MLKFLIFQSIMKISEEFQESPHRSLRVSEIIQSFISDTRVVLKEIFLNDATFRRMI